MAPYRCLECPYRASCSSNLSKHVRFVHRQERIRCGGECDFKTTSYSILKEHR